jgi:hypothetical protein
MPPLKRPTVTEVIDLPPRKATVIAKTDVLVVGGGPAGIGAALGSAQSGAHALLVERYGFLGGNATAALVMPLMSFHTHGPVVKRHIKNSLFPQDHGEGRPVIAGVLARFLARLIESGGAIRPSAETGYVVPFDPEVFKWTALDLLDEAGVEFLFHAFASDVIMDKERIRGVVFQTKSGPLVVLADMVIDATGDGDIAALAGAPYSVGREKDGLVQPMTLMFRMADFERRAFENYIKEHPDDWRNVHGLWDLIQKASARGELDLPREDILFFATVHDREVSVNSTRVTRVLGTDVWDLSYAEWVSRRQMKQIGAFLKKYVPGFDKAYEVQSGVQVGVRETRRIRGEYELTVNDILQARKFPDVIAQSAYPVDIHNPAGPGTILKRLPPNESYDIPLRALLPKKIANLLTAGRCISGTHEAHSSYRVMPTAMATGHAAGVCAALAVQQHRMPHEVRAEDVQRELMEQGADLTRPAAAA